MRAELLGLARSSTVSFFRNTWNKGVSKVFGIPGSVDFSRRAHFAAGLLGTLISLRLFLFIGMPGWLSAAVIIGAIAFLLLFIVFLGFTCAEECCSQQEEVGHTETFGGFMTSVVIGMVFPLIDLIWLGILAMFLAIDLGHIIRFQISRITARLSIQR